MSAPGVVHPPDPTDRPDDAPARSAASPAQQASAIPARSPAVSASGAPSPRPVGLIGGAAYHFHTEAEHDFDVVVVVNAEGRITFVSASAERLFGYDTRDAIGQDIFDWLDDEGRSAMRATFDDLVTNRRLGASLELSAIRPDGTSIVIEIVAANHLDDSIGGIVISIREVTARKHIEDQIREAEQSHASIIDSLVDGVMMVDANGVIVRVNEALETMFGSPGQWLIGQRLTDVNANSRMVGIGIVDRHGCAVPDDGHPLLQCLVTGCRYSGVIHGIKRAGQPPVWIRINAQPIIDPTGQVTGAVASFIDITEGRELTMELHREEQFLQVLLDTLEAGIVACDADGRITIFNPAARRLHGLTKESDPIGKIPSERGLRHLDGSPMGAAENPLLRAVEGDLVRNVELILETRTGVRRVVTVNGQTLIDDEGAKLGAVVAIHDVTEQKRNEERLAELALHDPLTGLANRTLLADRMQEALDRLEHAVSSGAWDAVESESRGVAVFLLDLDEFKEVNDALGHDVGDDVLVAVARRLQAIVRPSDTVARLGGDEFVVVCDVKRGTEEMHRITDRISSALADPYRIDGRTLTVLASVGGVLVTDYATDPSKVLSLADDAMYGVKWSRRRQRRSMAD